MLIKRTLEWLWDVKTKNGWGGNKPEDDPSIWTNASVIWILCDLYKYHLNPKDVDNFIKTVKGILTEDKKAYLKEGGYPIFSKGSGTASVSSTAYMILAWSTFIRNFEDRITSDEVKQIKLHILDCVEWLLKNYNSDKKGWTFFVYENNNEPTSLVCTSQALWSINKCKILLQNDEALETVLGKYDHILCDNCVYEIYNEKTLDLTKGKGLPLQTGLPDPAVASTSWALDILIDYNNNNNNSDINNLISDYKIYLLDADLLSIDIEYTTSHGPFEWFSSAIALRALLSQGFSVNHRVINRLFINLKDKSLTKDKKNNKIYWKLIENERHTSNISTWSSRDVVLALHTLTDVLKETEKKLGMNIFEETVIHERKDRVFVGGNYDKFMPILKLIVKKVEECNKIPIIANNFSVPKEEIYDTDLLLLHNCFIALFELSVSSGALNEIERTKDYNIPCYIFYSKRDEKDVFSDSKITSMVKTMPDLKDRIYGYSDFPELEQKISEIINKHNQ